MKKNMRVRTKKCFQCGANIAANLSVCPYCETQLPVKDYLPEEITRFITEQIKQLDGYINPDFYDKMSAALIALPIIIIPLMLSAVLFFIFNSLLLAILFFAGALAMSYIAIHSFYEYYQFSGFPARCLWKRKLKPLVKSSLKKKGFPEDDYYEVIMTALMNESVIWASDMGVVFDD